MSDQHTHRQPNALLRQERLLRGWSQQEVGNHVGTDGYTVSRWERGRALPSPYFRQRLCDLFGKNAQALGLLQQHRKVEVQPLVEATSSEPLAQGSGEAPALLTRIALPPYWQVPLPTQPLLYGPTAHPAATPPALEAAAQRGIHSILCAFRPGRHWQDTDRRGICLSLLPGLLSGLLD
jgi:transcriptional regulator with XRE-family HTH domain